LSRKHIYWFTWKAFFFKAEIKKFLFILNAMQSVLNFSKKELELVNSFLINFEALETKSPYEEIRCKIGSSVVTVFKSGKIVVQGTGHEKVKLLILEALEGKADAVIGVDETGRGEADGPFVVSSVLGKTDLLRELRDSKKTKNIKQKFGVVAKNSLAQAVVLFNPALIDSWRKSGRTINELEELAIDAQVSLLREIDSSAKVFVDGSSLKLKSKNVSFVVGGDDSEPVVGAASVVAKHLRDESSNKDLRKTWKNGSVRKK
jgi:ribonuclease HII